MKPNEGNNGAIRGDDDDDEDFKLKRKKINIWII
jgi:hypothetical protein